MNPTAQAPAPPTIEGNIYAVTYVEVMPTSRADGIALLKRYREATRKEDGNLRCEVVSRIGQPHQLAILEVWKDHKAFEAHGKSAHVSGLREKIQAIRNAPIDERVHVSVSSGPLQPGPAGDAVYVVTHVDVIPPRKDDGLAAVKQLAEDSRKQNGSLRFDVYQQTNRPNHFTVVETWANRAAYDAHFVQAQTKDFRGKLITMTGALYDERLYRTLD